MAEPHRRNSILSRSIIVGHPFAQSFLARLHSVASQRRIPTSPQNARGPRVAPVPLRSFPAQGLQAQLYQSSLCLIECPGVSVSSNAARSIHGGTAVFCSRCLTNHVSSTASEHSLPGPPICARSSAKAHCTSAAAACQASRAQLGCVVAACSLVVGASASEPFMLARLLRTVTAVISFTIH